MSMNQEQQLLAEERSNTTSHVVHSVLRFLWLLRRRKSIVLAILAASIVLGIIYFGAAPRVYQAKAQILVKQSQDPMSAQSANSSNTQNEMATWERLMTSAVVLERALAMLEILPPEIPHTSTREDAIEEMREMLNAQALRRTSIIELSCRSEAPEAAVYVVNAVVASYLEYIDEHHKSESTKVVAMLTQERQRLEQQLAMQEQQLIHAKQSCSDLGLDGDSGFVHPSIQNVIKYNEALLEVQQRRIQLQASQESINIAIQSGGDLRQHLITLQPLIGHDLLLSAVGLNPNETAAMNELETKVIEYQAELASLNKHYGPNHPEIQKLQNKIQTAQGYAATFQQRKQQQIAGMKRRATRLDDCQPGQRGPHTYHRPRKADAGRISGCTARSKAPDHPTKSDHHA